MFEFFFKTLKSGCKVESLQFEETSRLEPCLGVYLIMTWRVLLVCRLGRSHPDWSCEILFDESEWKSTYRVMHPGKEEMPGLKRHGSASSGSTVLPERGTFSDPEPKIPEKMC